MNLEHESLHSSETMTQFVRIFNLMPQQFQLILFIARMLDNILNLNSTDASDLNELRNKETQCHVMYSTDWSSL